MIVAVGFVRALIRSEHIAIGCSLFVLIAIPKIHSRDENSPFIYDKVAANAEIPHNSPGTWRPLGDPERGGGCHVLGSDEEGVEF
jgi:hypothetical protein